MNMIYLIGLLIIGIIFIIIGVKVIYTYRQQENKLSLYLISFFLSAGIGWIGLFFTILLEQEDTFIYEIAFFLAVISIVLLFLFSSTVLEFRKEINFGVLILVAVVTILHYIEPKWHLFTVLATLITISTAILFYIIFRRRKDFKSLGMSIGLILILVAESIQAINEVSKSIAGILFILSGIVIALGFFTLEK